MFTKSLKIVFVGLVSCAATAWAGPSALQGTVTDPTGQPVKGAEIRIEPRNGGAVLATAKTTANGRYTATGLPAGVYRVTLFVNGSVKASINNTKTRADKTTELNFQLKPAVASQQTKPAKKAKHMVWIPEPTGSHMGGRWVEVDEGAAASVSNVQTVSKAELQKQIQSSGTGREAPPFGR
jgi:hypothetical protein